MTPVKQTLFEHTFPYGGGNCLQACVASLFDKPLEAVPHFMLFGKHWSQALNWYLRSIGYDYLGWVEGEPPHDGQYYLASMDLDEKFDWYHAVIYKDGQVVHDPHPSEGGLLGKCAGYYSIQPINQKS